MTPAPTQFDELNELLAELVERVRGILGGEFVGAYLVGSFALGAGDEHSDADFIVATRRELSEEEQAALQRLHGELYSRPQPWAKHLEGSYVPIETFRRLDPSRRTFFFLDHGASRLVWDAHCNTASTRWTLREHGIVLAGPPPAELVDAVAAAELRAEALTTLREYAEWAREQRDAYASGDRRAFNRWVQVYLVLTVCRILATLDRGEVVTKAAAGAWALATLDGRWHDLIRRALADRPDPVGRWFTSSEPDAVAETFAFVDAHTAPVRAAGGVVVRDGRVLLVHRDRYDDWSLPKGKLEPGESWEAAALREVREETGLEATLGAPLGSTYYAAGGRPKEVRWFRMAGDGEPRANDEVDAFRWATIDDAAALLSYDGERELLSRLR